MDVQAAILTAIADRPADDTPRLAYADWLDDHAGDLPDPDAARVRAEFIRVQCEVKRLEHLPSALLQGYAELYRRQDHLLTHHRRDLLGPLADSLGPHDAAFDRGFVSELRLDAPTFATHAELVAALAPRPAVAVYGIGRHVEELSAVAEHLAVVTAAEVQSPRWADPEEMDTFSVILLFAAGWRWDGLRELNLEWCQAGDLGVAEIINYGRLPALTRLDLSGNAVGDAGVRALVTSPLWPQLRTLVLGANPISDEGAAALADAPPTALEYLNMKYTGLTRVGQQRLLRRKGWKVDLF